MTTTMITTTFNTNINSMPYDIENRIVQENETPIQENVYFSFQYNKEKNNAYFYEKVKLTVVSSILLLPFIVCSFYFAFKNNEDSCLKEHVSDVNITLYDYLVGIIVFYTFLWIFDIVLIYLVNFDNKRQVEKVYFSITIVHTLINIAASIYSIVTITVYNNVYKESLSSCSIDTKNYINSLLVINIFVIMFIIVLLAK